MERQVADRVAVLIPRHYRDYGIHAAPDITHLETNHPWPDRISYASYASPMYGLGLICTYLQFSQLGLGNEQ